MQLFFGSTFLLHFGDINRIDRGKAHIGDALVMSAAVIYFFGNVGLLRRI